MFYTYNFIYKGKIILCKIYVHVCFMFYVLYFFIIGKIECKEKSNHNFSNKENESYRIMITKNGKRSENDKGCQRTIIS